MVLPQSSQVPDGHQRSTPAVDPDRIDIRAGIAFEDDKRQAPALRRSDQADICAMAQDEAVDQRLPNGGCARFVRAVDEAQRRPGLVARKRNAKHQLSQVWASDHVTNGIGARRHKADRVELAVTEHSSSGVRPIVTKLVRRSLDALDHVRPHQVRVIEDIGYGAAGDSGDPADVG